MYEHTARIIITYRFSSVHWDTEEILREAVKVKRLIDEFTISYYRNIGNTPKYHPDIQW